jgi:hypothetical protein
MKKAPAANRGFKFGWTPKHTSRKGIAHVTKKPKFRPPYVGDDVGGFASSALAEIPSAFKTPRCCVCAAPVAPFGIGYPEDPKWFCRKHVGEVMPEVQENSNRVKMNEVRRRSVKVAKLWLDLYTAAANGDVDGCRGIWKHIRDGSVEVSDFLKQIEASYDPRSS